MHISEVKDKSAARLAVTPLDDDAYHLNIKQSAIYLAQKGQGDFVYHTQYETGTTVWYKDMPGETVWYKKKRSALVSPDDLHCLEVPSVTIKWGPDDIARIRPDWTYDQCAEALCDIEDKLVERSIRLGWELLYNDLKQEGEQ
jgi:hypothetical protein